LNLTTWAYTSFQVEQLHKIFKLCGSPSEEYWKRLKLPQATVFKFQQPYARCLKETFKDFPDPALSLLDKLLAIEPSDRGTASLALASEVSTFLLQKIRFVSMQLECFPYTHFQMFSSSLLSPMPVILQAFLNIHRARRWMPN
jgi:serine/threonine protein kinase